MAPHERSTSARRRQSPPVSFSVRRLAAAGSTRRLPVIIVSLCFATICFLYAAKTGKIKIISTATIRALSERPSQSQAVVAKSRFHNWERLFDYPEIPHIPPSVGDLSSPFDDCGRTRTSQVIDRDGTRWLAPSLPLPFEAGLEERLRAWKRATVADRSRWLEFNQETCFSVGRNEDKDHREKSLRFWESITPARTISIRNGLMKQLKAKSRAGETEKFGKGRGIVFSVDNIDDLRRVASTVQTLRTRFSNSLPIEIFYSQSATPTTEASELFASLDAKPILYAIDTASARGNVVGMKAHAMVENSFREFMYLDAKTIPVADVAPLFDAPAYKRLGLMMFPNFWKDSVDNAIWQVLGLQCRDEFGVDSRQILADKKKVLDVLLLGQLMLQNSGLWFSFSNGDKNIWRYAALALRRRWAVSGSHIKPAGLYIGNDKLCGNSSIQHDHLGKHQFVNAQVLQDINGDVRYRSWANPPVLEPLDGDVNCDMLANTDIQGNGIAPAPPNVRMRAALDQSTRVDSQHVKRSASGASCVDLSFENPRSHPNEESGKPPRYRGSATWCESRRDVVDWTLDSHKLGLRSWKEDPVLSEVEAMHGQGNDSEIGLVFA